METYYKKRVEELGGLTRKFSSPARRAVPDQVTKLEGIEMFLVECKRPGEEPTKAQEKEHKRWRRLGVKVYVVDSKQAVDQLLSEVVPCEG